MAKNNGFHVSRQASKIRYGHAAASDRALFSGVALPPCLTGFGTLASTGTLDAPAVALVGTALLIRGYLLSKRSEAQISADGRTISQSLHGLLCGGLHAALGNFLSATVHLVLFGMVIRLFSAQKDRDHYMLGILSFVMVLAAAVLTVDSVFLVAFAGFMLMAVSTFVLMEMRRSSHTATIPAARRPIR